MLYDLEDDDDDDDIAAYGDGSVILSIDDCTIYDGTEEKEEEVDDHRTVTHFDTHTLSRFNRAE